MSFFVQLIFRHEAKARHHKLPHPRLLIQDNSEVSRVEHVVVGLLARPAVDLNVSATRCPFRSVQQATITTFAGVDDSSTKIAAKPSKICPANQRVRTDLRVASRLALKDGHDCRLRRRDSRLFSEDHRLSVRRGLTF